MALDAAKAQSDVSGATSTQSLPDHEWFRRAADILKVDEVRRAEFVIELKAELGFAQVDGSANQRRRTLSKIERHATALLSAIAEHDTGASDNLEFQTQMSLSRFALELLAVKFHAEAETRRLVPRKRERGDKRKLAGDPDLTPFERFVANVCAIAWKYGASPTLDTTACTGNLPAFLHHARPILPRKFVPNALSASGLRTIIRSTRDALKPPPKRIIRVQGRTNNRTTARIF